jgi:signal transduction histidine kinase
VTAVPAPIPGLELGRHLRAAGQTVLYLALALVQAVAAAVLVVGGLAIGGALALVWIGLPLLALVVRIAWRLAEVERRQANRLLDAHLPPVARPAATGWRRTLEAARSRAFLRAVVLLALKLPVSLVASLVAAAPVGVAVFLLVLGLEGLGGKSEAFVGPWTLGPALGVLLCVLTLPAAIVSIAVLETVGRALRALAQALLRSEAAGAGPVRELLAERLGDRSLNIAYWLPDREQFVDERGRHVELPAAGSGRAWTAVERDGRRVAAIVHDAELDASPQLVQAAASAASLAIDNERLKAALRARVEELRISRRRIVEAADDARRRIERDLHDGAQQQLVSLALDLRMLRARVGEDEAAAAAVDAIAAKLATALAELRELARGIHPAVLADHGLGPAIHALVSRVPLPVECDIDVDGRLPAPVEAAAYFVVAEGLTNVVKYANASRVRVHMRHRDGALEVTVTDDGVGGARMDVGSGLRGLSDRVAALEGRLELDSPLGEGTRVKAVIPAGER